MSVFQPAPIWPTKIASHRGGAMEWPENSPTAFARTAALPVEYVEFDIHPSSDGILVVIHDATLDRTTDGVGPVIAKSWEELQAVRLNDTHGERPLRLEELIEIFRPTDIKLRLEIKPGVGMQLYDGIEAEALRILRAQNMLERTMISSFFLQPLARMLAIDPPPELVWLVNPLVLRSLGGVSACAAAARAVGVRELGLHQETIDLSVLEAALGVGMRLGAFATHSDEAIARMLQFGVTVFTTDRPTAALRARG